MSGDGSPNASESLIDIPAVITDQFPSTHPEVDEVSSRKTQCLRRKDDLQNRDKLPQAIRVCGLNAMLATCEVECLNSGMSRRDPITYRLDGVSLQPSTENSTFRALSGYKPIPWHFLYFLPEPHGQSSLRPTFSPERRGAPVPLLSGEAPDRAGGIKFALLLALELFFEGVDGGGGCAGRDGHWLSGCDGRGLLLRRSCWKTRRSRRAQAAAARWAG